MSIGKVLEVGIGLIFVFLLLGLIVSALQELVAALLKLRSKYLMEGLSTILAETAGACWLARRHLFSSRLDDDQGSGLFKTVADHALVNGITPSKIPSYVPASNFASALIDVLRKGGTGAIETEVKSAIAALPDGPAKQALNTLFTDAKGNIDAFRKNVETWFDGAMERVSGRYKRWTQYFALLAGVVIAVALNANTILIADALWRDPVLRASAVKAAEAYLEDCQANPDTCPVSAESEGETPSTPAESNASSSPSSAPAPAPDASSATPSPAPVPAPVDSSATPTPAPAPSPDAEATPESAPSPTEAAGGAATPAADTQAANAEDAEKKIADFKATVEQVTSQLTEIGYPIGWTMMKSFGEWQLYDWVVAVLGWLITGLAVSLGAPFWFDMLKTFVNVRGAGPKPVETKPGT